MAKLRATGRLQHHFWGNYVATIVLLFQDAASATDALTKLVGFKAHPTTPKALVFCDGGDAFEAVKAMLTAFRVPSSNPTAALRDEEPLDSCDKSIDYGPPFEIEVEVNIVSVDQLSLF